MNKEEIHKTTLAEYSQVMNKYMEMIDLEDGYKINDYISNLEYDNQQLKRVIDKAIEFLKEFHNYEKRFKWCEQDYIDTIEELEKILRGEIK